MGETSRSRFPRKWIFSSLDWNCFGPRIGDNWGPWWKGCTGSIPGDGCSSVSVGPRGVRRVIGIQSNIAEKLFTNETPLSGNVPLLHQEGGTGWECGMVGSGQGLWPQDIDFGIVYWLSGWLVLGEKALLWVFPKLACTALRKKNSHHTWDYQCSRTADRSSKPSIHDKPLLKL